FAAPFAHEMRRADHKNPLQSQRRGGGNRNVGFAQPHLSHENRRITGLKSLDDAADRVHLACDGPSGYALYELVDFLPISPRMVEGIRVPAHAGDNDGAEFFDKLVDVHAICRYSPVFRSNAFI